MGIFNWLARKIAAQMPPPPAPAARPALDLGQAMQTMLVDAVKASGEAVAARTKSDTEFLTAMAEIRNKTAAQALGSAGGKERARRAKIKREADPTWCPVCKHDNSRSTRAIILWHMRKHEGPRPPMTAGVPNGDQSTTTASNPGEQSDQQLRAAKSDTGAD